MPLTFYNTMGRSREIFKPIEPGVVKLYTCGPTVYNDAHIGNFRTYVFEDLLRRTLKYLGYNVTQVMNITDIDDKTIRESRKAGCSLSDFTKPITERFFKDLDRLNIERAECYPVATGHIPEMIELVQNLIDKGYAYIMDGSVYFSIEKYKDYGKLSGMKMAKMKRGARIDADEYEKDDFRDFALWRGWTEDDGDVYWDAPFGKGRPGWHIECSAMSMKYLGIEFDIHTGGVDNLFPHHENEIAQSACANNNRFVKYWLHSAHLMVDGEKMAKSAGNFFTISDLVKRGHSLRAIRYTLLTAHYRQQLNISDEIISSSQASLERLDTLKHLVEGAQGRGEIREKLDEILSISHQKYRSSLEDDLNISKAVSVIFEIVSDVNKMSIEAAININEGQAIIKFLKNVDEVLGFLFPEMDNLPQSIRDVVFDRLEARKEKHYRLADEIRDSLLLEGYQIKDVINGTEVIWDKGREIVK